MVLLFDERTKVFRDGKQVTLDDLKKGDRAYVDTTLDGKDVFALNIHLVGERSTGQSRGQILWFNASSGELMLRDSLSPEPVIMRLASDASIVRGEHTAEWVELRSGSLVELTFTPASRGVPIVRQIAILASPGANFVFAGKITYFDLHRGLLALTDPRDNKSYEVSFNPSNRQITQDLRLDADVTVQTGFDGTHYQVRAITVNQPHAQAPPSN